MKLGLLLFEAATMAAIIALLAAPRRAADARCRLRLAPAAHLGDRRQRPRGRGHDRAAAGGPAAIRAGADGAGRRGGTLGALIKPTALLALPVFWRPWDWRLPLAVALTIVLAYLPYLSVGAGVLGFLPGYLQEEGFASGSGSGFKLLWLVEQVAGPLPLRRHAYIGLAALVLIGLALAVGFRSDRSEEASIRSLGWLLIAFLVLSSPHYPWYFLVLVPFLALAPPPRPGC